MKPQLFLILLLLPFMFGCNLFYPKAHFHLITFSKDKPTTNITVKFAGDVIYSCSLNYSSVTPDIQYYFKKRASKGKYNIVIEADSGRIKECRPLMLGKDKWIIIGCSYTKPMDSAMQVLGFGFVDSGRLKGIVASVTVDARNEPIKQYY